MEGVVDHHVRELLSALGGIDICVTEFVRVNEHQRLPERVFKRLCPELNHGCKTPSGVPVRVQLLGGQPGSLAFNAAKVARMGATAVDLNFGCPAKTVNKSDGGATLLKTPERLFNIISVVRDRVPDEVPVTAKIRLGFEDRSLYLDNARAAFEAGANELVVHARSKADGYKPPAYWEYIARIREEISIPVIANGEIWNVEDWQRCKEQSGSEDFMLGRGALATPDLPRQIQAFSRGEEYQPLTWQQVCQLLFGYYQTTKPLYPAKYLGNRVKQWLAYLRLQYPEAGQLFENIKRLKTAEEMEKQFLLSGAVID
jgi:tRNA-dihydrouridine synthase C